MAQDDTTLDPDMGDMQQTEGGADAGEVRDTDTTTGFDEDMDRTDQ